MFGLKKPNPVWEGVLVACFLGFTATVNTYFMYSKASAQVSHQMKEGLTFLARAAAASVDANLHKTLTVSEQEKTEDYRQAVRPLEHFLKSLPELRYIYTARYVGGKIYFVLDSAPIGDKDGDGVQDHSYLMDPYEDPDEEFLVTLREGKIRVSDKPYQDKWGTFISAYAPFFNSDGKLEGAVGIDMTAKDFLGRIVTLQNASLYALLVQWMICGLIGFTIFLVRGRLIKAQQDLVQLQKLESVDALAGGLAHDLNNQLTPLTGYLDILLLDADPKSSNTQYLTKARQAAIRCSSVVKRILSFSKPSMQSKVNTNLVPLLQELEGTLAQLLPSNIQIQLDVDPKLWPVHCDPSQIHTVLNHMAVNSREAMESGGKLAIMAGNTHLASDKIKKNFQAGPYIQITVSDSGHGIPAEVLPKIFDPFFTTKSRHKHSGMGLSMAYSIIKDLKGWMDVESTSAKGTRLSFYIPADIQESAAIPIEEEVVPIQNGQQTVLVTDDEETLRSLMQTMLNRLGYRVLLASDGLECIKIYKKNSQNIHIVLMDMIMPKYSGHQALKELLQFNPSAKILMMSGYTQEKSWKELLNDGAIGYVAKPFTLIQIKEALALAGKVGGG